METERLTDEQVAAIRERHAKATEGPWHWGGYRGTHHLYLMGKGGLVVMDFVRWGMQNAQARFRNVHDLMVNCKKLLTLKGCNERIVGIDHPDADFIANAPTDITALLAERDALVGEINILRLALDAAIQDGRAYLVAAVFPGEVLTPPIPAEAYIEAVKAVLAETESEAKHETE